jgi:hypothetical protein
MDSAPANKRKGRQVSAQGDYLRSQLGTVTTFNQCLEAVANAFDANYTPEPPDETDGGELARSAHATKKT